jgi:hypothetical protein
MMDTPIDPAFAAVLRAALVEHVTNGHRVQRRHRVWAGLGMVAGIGLVGGGAAVATGLWGQPGAAVEGPLAASVTVTRTGSAVVELGQQPAGANSISLALTCLTPGQFTYADGASMGCIVVGGRGSAGDGGESNWKQDGEYVTGIKRYSVYYGKANSQLRRHRPWQ